MSERKAKTVKGVKIGQTVYSIITRAGEHIAGPLELVDAGTEEDLVSVLDKLALEVDEQISLYKCIKIATSSYINYEKYLRSALWKEKAEAAKERAGHRCQVCNGQENLEAHHRTYERLGDEAPEDLTVLCRKCHELFSKHGRLKK